MIERRLNNLTIHQLRVFCTVAQHLSYTRAANVLGCKQPTVSAIIADLEKTTHLVLFEHQGRHLSLTDEGRELHAHAQQVIAAADELYHAVAELQRPETAREVLVSVAADTTVGTYVMPHLLGVFHRLHPEITLSLQVANRAGVRALLLERRVELVIAGRPPEGEGLTVKQLLPNRLVAIASPKHPLVGRAKVPLAELAAERFVLREEGSGTRAAIEELFEIAGLPLKVGMVLGHIESIKQAVMVNLGVSILSDAAIQHELAQGTLALLSVEGLPIPRHWYITHLETPSLSPGAASFVEFLQAENRAHEDYSPPPARPESG